MGGYTQSLEHHLEELRRIDLLIRLEVLKFRVTERGPMDAFQGLYITEEEIDASLDEAGGVAASSALPSAQLQPLLDQLAAMEEHLAARKADSRQAGTVLRLERLQELFQLSPFDVDALLICLAPALDLRYEKLYAYLQDDVTRKQPNVQLVLNLLCPSHVAKLKARAHFTPTASLLAAQLVRLGAAPAGPQASFLARPLEVDTRIVEYLLDSDHCDARLLPYIQWGASQMSWPEISLPADLKQHLEQLVHWYVDTRAHGVLHAGGLILYFQGPSGVGKRTTAAALCDLLGIPLLVVNVARLLRGDLPYATAIQLLCREALLQQAALYFAGFDLLLVEDEQIRQCRDTLIEELEHLSGLTFLAGQIPWEPVAAWHRKVFIQVEIPAPSYTLRKQLWEVSLNGQAPDVCDPGTLASRFRLSPRQIQDAVATAGNLARWRDPENATLMPHDLERACRAHSSQQLTTLTQKIQSHAPWSDLVLPKEHMAQLREIVSAVQHRYRVYGEWGFERKLSLGKGVNVLFCGHSGTGKTMAAGIMAGELGLDLYKINLSTVVSKYIGETEKNLSNIFQEAQDANAILFFDEADALFGKRSEVKDAHDRYANIEIAYLLQRMEEYEGVVILATNLRKNMDEAFVRRMHATVEFPFPDDEYRQRIWEGIFPSEAPVSADFDVAFLARQFKLTGGNIKNIALHAAFQAAEEGGTINMTHVIRAIKREFQKMGRLCNAADFREYYDLLKA